MRMVDANEIDDKIIAVANNDPFYKHFETLEDLPPSTVKVIKQFFEIYKAIEKKDVEVGEILGAKEANKIVEESIQLYKESFEPAC